MYNVIKVFKTIWVN